MNRINTFLCFSHGNANRKHGNQKSLNGKCKLGKQNNSQAPINFM